MSGESGAEISNELLEKEKIVDMLDPKYKLHWAPINNLPSILRKGLLSVDFAERIGDEDYESRGPLSRGAVYLYTNKKYIWGDPSTVVGVLIDDSLVTKDVGGGIEFGKFRVAPRNFIGLVVADDVRFSKKPRTLADKFFAGKNLRNRVKNIQNILVNSGIKLPIYGNSGDMYSPRRMRHKQIAGEFGGKK